MEPTASKFTKHIGEISRLLNRTLYWILTVTLVALIGIVCYVLFCHDVSTCLGAIALGCGTLVVVCALCWLGLFGKRLLDVQNDCRKQLLETELSLYREAIRREGLLQDKRTTIAKLDLELEEKRKEKALAELEKELKALK